MFVEPQQQRILRVPHHQLAVVIEQRKAVAHRQKGGFKLGAFLFQQAGGLFQRSGVARKDVECPRQFAQFVTPLQRRYADVTFTARQPRHGTGDRRQVRTEVAVDIQPGEAGNHQRQQCEQADKPADGAELTMRLVGAQLRLIRHLLHVKVDVVVEHRHQGFDMVGVIGQRQIALLQLQRFGQQALLTVAKLPHFLVYQGIRAALRPVGHHAVELLGGGLGCWGLNGDRQQSVDLAQQRQRRLVQVITLIEAGDMPQCAL